MYGDVIRRVLGTIPGVDRVDTDLCVEMYRYDPEVAVLG